MIITYLFELLRPNISVNNCNFVLPETESFTFKSFEK